VRRAQAAFEKGVTALAPGKLTTARSRGCSSCHHRGTGREISDEQYLLDVRRTCTGRVVVGNDLDIY
jgi:hypothetical protein